MRRTANLNMLYVPFLVRLIKGLKKVNDAGIPLRAFETYRPNERQSWLYQQGRSRPGNIITRARAGRSWHNYGIAADLVLYIDGKWTWQHEDLYLRAGPIIESCGLEWLGRGKRFVELVHYQLPVEQSIYEVESIYKTGGMLAVWDKFNERWGDQDLWKN